MRSSLRGLVFMFWVVVLGVTACMSSKTISEKRAARAATAQGEVVIGIVDSSNFPSMFSEGIEFAVNEINQRGGVLGRKLKTLVYDDEGDDTKGWKIAQELAENEDVIAVVGHLYSSVAISASIVYEKAGLLFLSPGAMDPSLTRYGGDFTFRNIPNGEEVGRQAADFGFRQNIKKVVVFYQREDTYKRLMENFNAQAERHGTEVVTTRSFFSTETDFKPLLTLLKKQFSFDGIFIIGGLPAAGILIKQIRDLGIKTYILGTTDLDTMTLWTVAGKAAEGTVVMTVFDPGQPNRLTHEFVGRFQALYGIEPDAWAAQGYDAIQVLVAAMEQSGSTVPIVLSSALRFLENWEGVTGSYSFTVDGDISGKPFFFKIARSGGFELLERERLEQVEIDPLYVVKDITLRIALPHELDTIDPALARTDYLGVEVIEQLFLGLTSLDPQTYQAVPALAEDWTISDDGTVYQFHLRQDVTWTDGLPVTAHDVVRTIQHNIALHLNSPTASLLYVLKNAEAIHKGKLQDISAIGVRARDYFTVEFTLEHPVVYFPTMLSSSVFRPLPVHVIEAYEDTWTAPEYIQTNGAYRLTAWEKGHVMILRKNPDYYDAEQVAIPEIRYYIVPSPSVGMALYRQDEIDIMGGSYLAIPLDEISRVKNHPVLNQEYSNPPQFETVAYYFNTKRPPVDNVLVRKAIAAAIERQLLVDVATQGDKEQATTFTRPPIFGSVAAGQGVGIDFNPFQAKEWLAEAGYPDGQEFPEITIVTLPEYRVLAYPLQGFLKHYLHIRVKLQEVSLEEYEKLLDQSEMPHMFVFPWLADYPDASSFLYETLHPLDSPNYVGWDNTEFAKLVENAISISEPEARKALYKRAEQILCEEEVAIIPLYYSTAPMLVKPRVKGWYYMALGGQHIRNWALGE